MVRHCRRQGTLGVRRQNKRIRRCFCVRFLQKEKAATYTEQVLDQLGEAEREQMIL